MKKVVAVEGGWVAADDGGWVDGVFPTEELAWAAVGGRDESEDE